MNPRLRRSHVSHDRWLVSYADFITLLFCFFVVLFAFARADQKKHAQVKDSVSAAFESLGLFPTAGRLAAKNDLDRIHRELEQTLSNQVAAHTVSIQMGRDGLVISLREAGFFSSGSAIPKPETLPTLRQIAAALSTTPYDVRIEGHTDNIPIHNDEFDSNWELSASRAIGIARLLIGLKVISPERISAAGYAEYHPVASNDNADGRAENRRVDLVVVPRTQINFTAPEPVRSGGKWIKITDDK